MATALVSLRSTFLSLPVVKLLHRVWWARYQRVCDKCHACGEKIESNELKLLKAGHYRAAVCMARIRLERQIVDMCVDLPNYNGIEYGGRLFDVLLFDNRITKKQYVRGKAVYALASDVIHGRTNSPVACRQIVYECRNCVAYLRDMEKLPIVVPDVVPNPQPILQQSDPLASFQLLNVLAEGGAI